jgi:hypothetical protein
MCLGLQCRHSLEALIAKLHHASARCAQQMFVIGRVARRFEAAKALPEITFDDEAALDEHIECAVDRRCADVCSARASRMPDILGGEVAIGRQHDIGNRKPLPRDRQIALTQKRFKRG